MSRLQPQMAPVRSLSCRVVFTLKDEPDIPPDTLIWRVRRMRHAYQISGQPRRTSSRSSRLPSVQGDTNAVGSGPNLFGHDDECVTSLPLVLAKWKTTPNQVFLCHYTAREVLQLTQVCGSHDAFSSLVFPLIEKVPENNLEVLKVPDKNLEALMVQKKNLDKV
ncbi:hypothetical protein Tco_0625489 [Tanacetum coccineum]|uniref:Uncharacterized protein n=1 Tax=Tanacetum coccineum TaxID=301880 RepID=A0ABQ4WGX0_9ASTR